MKVILLPEVLEYFNKLTEVLYEEKYFSFEEKALQYVDDLLTEIETTLPNRQKKIAPSYFDRYGKGMHYSVFKKSKNTQWYVFFTVYENKKEIIYLVRFLSNNHRVAQFLHK